MKTDFNRLDHIVDRLKEHGRAAAASLKVVIFTADDLQFAKQVHQRYPDIPFFFRSEMMTFIQKTKSGSSNGCFKNMNSW